MSAGHMQALKNYGKPSSNC